MSLLQSLKPLPVAREVQREEALSSPAREYARDRVTLGWEDRLKGRGRRTSDGGFQFGTALPRGTILRSGDCFVFDDQRLIVTVAERADPVFVITAQTPAEWGLVAYYIGNNHQPLMLADDGIVCPDVPGMQELLELHGIAFTRATRAFTPVGQLADHQH